MANVTETLKAAMEIDGAIGVALVDYGSGMVLGQAGGGPLDLEVAAAGNTEIIRAQMKTMQRLGINDRIEDILITLGGLLHILRILGNASGGEGLFLYLALNKGSSNLAMARRQLQNLESQLVV